MNYISIKVFVFVLVLHIGSLEIKGQDISFKHIGTQEGLSQSSVSAIVQDTLGRIWMGTRDGVNLFDGSAFKTFRPIRGDSASLLGHFITEIVEDGECLWIISKSGVSKFYIESQRFVRYKMPGAYSLIKYGSEILLGTREGIFTLDSNSRSFERNPEYLDHEYIIQSFCADSSNKLWMCTNEGLYLYFPEQKETRRILGINCTKVFIDSKGRIWVGTYSNGIFLLDDEYRILRQFHSSGNESSAIVSNIIRDIEEDLSGNIWIGTFLGLSIISPNDGFSVTNYTHDEKEASSLSHNSILCITRDEQGGMWLGTYFGGANYFHPEFNIFTSYPKVSDDNAKKESLGYNVIGEILEADDGNIWISTEGGGVDKYDPGNQTFSHFRLKEESSELTRMDMNVKALQFIHEDTLLIGTHLSGLKELNVKTGSVKSFLPDPGDSSSIPSNIVEEIIPYREDNYLLGTKEGVVVFNAGTEIFSYFIYDEKGNAFRKRVNCLLIDRFGVLWIGTMDEGLFSYDPATKNLKKYYSSTTDLTTISSNNISFIYEDHYFRLWFGTHGGGLDLYDRESDSFQYFNVENSDLSSNFIQGIEKSRRGNLWISTSKGLSLFDFKNKYFYNFSNENGFPLKEPNHRAICLTDDGTLFVGGIDGLVSFREEDVLNRESNFRLNFSTLEVNGQLIAPNDSSRILTKDLAFTNAIKLKPNQQFFTIRFSACNYVSTKQYNYRYKFENDPNDWISIKSQNSLTFSKLPPGTYTLRVQAVSSDVETVIDEARLNIVILAPWYLRWYALSAYLVVTIFLFWFLNRMYRARIRVLGKLKAEKREKEQIKKLNQAKLKFFTNVSHEFKTPLTIITGLLESVLEKQRDKKFTIQKIRKSLENVYRLNHLVNELLDFRKLETGHVKLKIKEYSFNGLICDVFGLFSETAAGMHIKYDLDLSSESISFLFDYSQLEKVFFNLISNAFKAVESEKGKITIEVFTRQDRVITKVKDNGVGISSRNIDRIFDPYFQADNIVSGNFGKGSGIGLALSKEIVNLHNGTIEAESVENAYTVFIVEIPIRRSSHVDTIPEKEDNRNAGVYAELKETSALLPGNNLTLSQENPELSNKEGQKILVVEDNVEVQRFIFDILKEDFNILFCNNGKDALDLVLKEFPALIISDVMMPVMTGTEMCAILKRNIETCHIPVILLTAKSSVEARLEGYEYGADDYISKPFHASILKARVKNILQNRELIQKRFCSDPNMKVKEVVSNPVDEEFLKKATGVVEDNIENADFNVQDFADAMNMSKSKFYNKVKSITGQTPNDFILSIRLKRAATYLLGKENITVAEVAYSVGYKDPRYFSKSFRQYFGISPSHYGKSANS